MAQKGQEKRVGLRLDLTKETAIGNNTLNTPALNEACDMALPTPLLTKKVYDMYPSKEEQQHQAPVASAVSQVQHQVNSYSTHNATLTTLEPINSSIKSYGQSSQYSSSPVVVVIQPSNTRLAASSQPQKTTRIGLAHPKMIDLPIIDPRQQEELKVARKRERNRAAAQRCREKKLNIIQSLTDEVKQLENERSDVIQELRKLQAAAVSTLQCVSNHESAGCDLKTPDIVHLVKETQYLQSSIEKELVEYDNMDHTLEHLSNSYTSEQDA